MNDVIVYVRAFNIVASVTVYFSGNTMCKSIWTLEHEEIKHRSLADHPEVESSGVSPAFPLVFSTCDARGIRLVSLWVPDSDLISQSTLLQQTEDAPHIK